MMLDHFDKNCASLLATSYLHSTQERIKTCYRSHWAAYSTSWNLSYLDLDNIQSNFKIFSKKCRRDLKCNGFNYLQYHDMVKEINKIVDYSWSAFNALNRYWHIFYYSPVKNRRKNNAMERQILCININVRSVDE